LSEGHIPSWTKRFTNKGLPGNKESCCNGKSEWSAEMAVENSVNSIAIWDYREQRYMNRFEKIFFDEYCVCCKEFMPTVLRMANDLVIF